MLTRVDAEGSERCTDEDVVKRVLAGDLESFEILMRRHNQRLYRIGCSILHQESEAEDVIQDAFVRAYEHLNQFAGEARFSTWLSRIAVNEALARKRRRHRCRDVGASAPADPAHDKGDGLDQFPSAAPNPEENVAGSEHQQLLENAIRSLPEKYRVVVVMRDLQEMDVRETAFALAISEQNVKTRLHRARALLRRKLSANIGHTSKELFAFHAVRCDRVVHGVFARLQALSVKSAGPMSFQLRTATS